MQNIRRSARLREVLRDASGHAGMNDLRCAKRNRDFGCPLWADIRVTVIENRQATNLAFADIADMRPDREFSLCEKVASML
jgi:hypothetical protein